eukprot:sb/3465634/
MKRVVCGIDHTGAVPFFEYSKVYGQVEPVLQDHEVVVQVSCCTVQRKRLTNQLRYLFGQDFFDQPEGVGSVGVGTISQVGSEVTDIRVGARVVFLVPEISHHSGLATSVIVLRCLCVEIGGLGLEDYSVAVAVEALIPVFVITQHAMRGDTVLLCDAHTPAGQMALQVLDSRGCKVVVYMREEGERDILFGPYRSKVDSTVEGWLHRNPKSLVETLISESENMGFNVIITLQQASPFYPDGAVKSKQLSPGTLPIGVALMAATAGAKVVVSNYQQPLSPALSELMFNKSICLQYLNPSALISSPSRLGSLQSFLVSCLDKVEKGELVLPNPISRVSMEDAVRMLNNKLDPMAGSYVAVLIMQQFGSSVLSQLISLTSHNAIL